MSEKLSQPLAADAGTKAQPPVASPVAGQPVSAAAVAAAVPVAPALFGGHRGGGKKRGDGLPAGSAEARAADLAADAERKRASRAAKKMASLPPPLPGVATAAANENPSLAAGSTGLPVPVAGVAGVAAPLFVPWTTRVLEKPARRLTKIIGRVRVWSLAKKIHALQLDPKDEKEIVADLAWKESAVADFNAALAETATVELNKRGAPGAANSHWIALAMSGGELLYAHTEALNRIEALLLKKRKAGKRESGNKVNNLWLLVWVSRFPLFPHA